MTGIRCSLTLAVSAVALLVVAPIAGTADDRTPRTELPSNAGAAPAPATPELNGGTNADFSELIDLIQAQTGDDEDWEQFGGDGTINSFESGIRVDATGLLVRARKLDQRRELSELQQIDRPADLSAALQQPTDLRVVSLRDIEAIVAASIAAERPVPAAARYLGGLTRVQYVFAQDGDICLAGPAEGWSYDKAGRAIGTASGRPVLHLDDLVVVLRSLDRAGQFGCSIDPRQENIRAVQNVIASTGGRSLSPAGTRAWTNRLEDALGRQDVSVHGVPADSRVARVMVEADYRMKLIGAGEFDAVPSIPSYFDLLAAHPEHIGGSFRGLRWWLTLDVDAIAADESGRAFAIDNCSVLCRSENQLLQADGQRVGTGTAEPMNELFAANFTEHYAELAATQPIFAELQSVFDLSLVAAIIDREQLDLAAGFDRGCLASGGAYQTARYPVAREVESVVAHRVYPGGRVVVQAAGGVDVPVASLATDEGKRTVKSLDASVQPVDRKAFFSTAK